MKSVPRYRSMAEVLGLDALRTPVTPERAPVVEAMAAKVLAGRPVWEGFGEEWR